MFSSSKKPKFNLSLTINELSNIPQLTGSCYIKISIKNKQKGNHSITPSNLGHVNVETTYKKVHNYKCLFNYKLSVDLKFLIHRKNNLISNKYLLLTVFHSNKDKTGKDNSSQLLHHADTELGSIEINLSEYLNFKNEISNKYLLQNSKINSILNLTIFLKPINNESYNSSISINDSRDLMDTSSDGTSVTSHSNSREKQSYNIPTFERKNVFKGLTGVINDEDGSSSFNSEKEREEDKVATKQVTGLSSINSDSHQHLKPQQSQQQHHEQRQRQQSHEQQQQKQQSQSFLAPSKTGRKIDKKEHTINTHGNALSKSVILDPIVSKLYSKIFQNSWDINSNFIELSPEECINDIFNGGDGWGDNPKALDNIAAEDLDSLNGLLSETAVREDLKSWAVSASG